MATHVNLEVMDAILPAAGLATRMRGLPKFLLPCNGEYTSLIERHLEFLKETCDTLWIPVRPEYVGVLSSLLPQSERVILLPMRTETMSESVRNVLRIASAQSFFLAMPDTFFLGQQPYKRLDPAPELVDLAIWEMRDEQKGKLGQVLCADGVVDRLEDKDPNCDFPHVWGAMTFSRKLGSFVDPAEPHIGYAVASAIASGEPVTAKIIEGSYFDCGTPREYISMLEQAFHGP